MGQYTEAIEKLYVAYFNRGADPAGLAFWEKVVAANNGDTSSISELFATSPEYLTAYSGMSTANIINQIYRNLFGRDAEAEGRDFWASNFDAGRLTMANVVTAVSKGAQGSDKTAFDAKVSAATIFTNSLDTPEKMSSYAGEDALVVARNFLSTVTDAASLEKASQTVGEHISIMQNHINLHGKKPLFFSRGQDKLQGTDGDDHYFAQANPGSTSLNKGDSLDAGKGTDSLSVFAITKADYTLPSVAITNLEKLSVLTDKGLTADISAWEGLTMATLGSTGATTVTAGNTNLLVNVNQGSSSIKVDGTGDITINANAIASGGKIDVGTVTPAKGNVTINTNHNVATANGKDDIASNSAGPIHVVGGKEITISQLNEARFSPSWYEANITVDGTVDTSKVTVKVGIPVSSSASQKITINDVHAGSASEQGTIKSLNIEGRYENIIINDNALEEINLSYTSSTKITLNNAGLNTPNTTLNIGMGTGDSIDLVDAGVLTKLNFNLAGDNSRFSTLNSSKTSALESITVKGLGLFSVFEDIPSLRSITASEKAGLNITSAGGGRFSGLELIDTSNSSQHSNLYLANNTVKIIGGSDSETVTINAATVANQINLAGGEDTFDLIKGYQLKGASIDGGAGKDTLSMYVVDAENLPSDSSLTSQIKNFEVLKLQVENSDSLRTVDLAKLGSTVKDVDFAFGSVIHSTINVDNFGSGGTVNLGQSASTVNLKNPAFAKASNDVVNVTVTSVFVNTFTELNAHDVETINVKVHNYVPVDGRAEFSLGDNSLQNLTLQGSMGIKLINTASTIKKLDASGLSIGGFEWVSGALASSATINGSAASVNIVDTSAAKAAPVYVGGSNTDAVTVGAAGALLRLGTGLDQVILKQAGANLNSLTTVLDPHAGITIVLPDHGTEVFARSRLSLVNATTLQEYADAAVNSGGDSSQHAHSAWFQFNNDTYYVQSHHNAVSTPGFVNGTDFIVKLTGQYDLGTAFLGGVAGNTLAVG